MEDVNGEAGIEGVSFHEFLEQTSFFFAQRHTEKGAHHIFQVLDDNFTDQIKYEDFKKILNYAGFNLSEEQSKDLFIKATGSLSTHLDMKIFNEIMRGPFDVEYKFDEDEWAMTGNINRNNRKDRREMD